ncbi:TetR/AcrR family transcriptional regulator [Labedaea rhizosphaerae]|uniref:TetR/AcrR family transcriptional regulator n=1 Tax=Labedaea rhizosphaerae TaxID=598644 RepID=UPI001FB78912|nr:TetR/AcrR family transcriptional regulator [Labedaea rhizosphaerae]
MTDELLPPGLVLAWDGAEQGVRRGPKPAHSVDSVVAAAIAVADAEGYAALSMPRIARQLKITANALYRYVASRDELIVLMVDAAWGLPPDDIEASTDWREACTRWVQAMLARMRARPWLVDAPVRGAPSTPNLLRWLEVFLSAMDGCGLTPGDVLGCAMLLDGYARSTAQLDRDLTDRTEPAVDPARLAGFLVPRLIERGYPRLAQVMTGGGYSDGPIEDDDVDFGLGRILDGIDVLISRKP